MIQVGKLDNIPIKVLNRGKEVHFGDPSKYEAKRIFNAYKSAFPNYTSEFIAYYLYKRVKQTNG